MKFNCVSCPWISPGALTLPVPSTVTSSRRNDDSDDDLLHSLQTRCPVNRAGIQIATTACKCTCRYASPPYLDFRVFPALPRLTSKLDSNSQHQSQPKNPRSSRGLVAIYRSFSPIARARSKTIFNSCASSLHPRE